MRGHFSIEWMAKSSLSAEPGSPSVSTTITTPGCSTSGTHSETLPGFYYRPRPGTEASSGPAATHGFPSNPSFPTKEAGVSNQEIPRKSNNQQVAETESGFSSGTEEETSGYESEGGRSLSSSTSSSPVALPHSRGLPPPPSPQSRRPRTAFTAEQVHSLERAFKKNAYLGTQDKSELCRKLNLSDKQIRNWFQNRRMKLKRTVQDALAHACQAHAVATQFLHYPDLPGYRPAPYPQFAASPPLQEVQSSVAAQRHLHPYGHPSPATTTTTTTGLPRDSGFFHHQYPTLPAGMVLPTVASGHLMAGYPGAYPTQHY
ncbi:ventrally expressed dharma/bozozok antagonist [Gadus morhua]|uniref:ventrally expressed dharma/bozozok antagonist n=1 Tax=Gadus morhua TaxID=8049 RepID=UPI0011B7E19A|nr:homeobox protein vex1-like [Gadus morhua]